jgi:hypothetical protein
MRKRTLRRAIFFTTAALSLGALAMPVAAQETKEVVQGLYENQTYIRGCRQTNSTVEVFDNSSLGPVANRIGSLPAGTQVLLTGVLANGRAQVYLRDGDLSSVQPTGWIDAGHLAGCGSTPTPPPTQQACFRANVDLNVRSSPSTGSGSQVIAAYNAGDTIRTTTNPPTQHVSPDTAPDYGRIWMQVSIYDGRPEWISRTGYYGQGSNVTSIACP